MLPRATALVLLLLALASNSSASRFSQGLPLDATVRDAYTKMEFDEAAFLTATKLTPKDYDAVVVGAGISGLTTARTLLRAGHRVVVVEAQSIVGGRCYRQPVSYPNGTAVPCSLPQCKEGIWYYDQGGQWVGPTHHRFLAMAAEYGVETYNASQWQGLLRLYINGTPVVLPSSIISGVPLTPADIQASNLTQAQAASLDEYLRLMRLLHAVEATVNVEAPWKTPKARKLDTITFADWLDQNSDDRFAKDLVIAIYPAAQGALGGMQAHWVSLLHVARQLKAGPQEEEPEQMLFWGGAGQFQELLAREVEALGGRIVVSSPARHISQTKEGVTVYSDKGVFTARYAVVAMPPHLTGRISYNPRMPPMRSQLVQRVPMGSVVKVLAFYDKPFWRTSDNISQTVTAVADPSPFIPIDSAFDVSPPGGPGVLAWFLWDERAFALLEKGDAELQRVVLETWAGYFNSSGIAAPLNFVHVDWMAEEWTGGGYTAFLPPGGWTTFGKAMFSPVGRIHWAGTEVSSKWPGFYEGAIIAGERAAEAVSALLKTPPRLDVREARAGQVAK